LCKKIISKDIAPKTILPIKKIFLLPKLSANHPDNNKPIADAKRKDFVIHATLSTPMPYSMSITGIAIFSDEDIKLLKNEPITIGY